MLLVLGSYSIRDMSDKVSCWHLTSIRGMGDKVSCWHLTSIQEVWLVHISWSFPRSWLITRFVTRLPWWVPLVEQELLTFPEHLSSPSVFSGVRVTRSLVLYVCFVDRCLSFCSFSFGHCVVFSSSIYGFWLLLWYLQTLLSCWLLTIIRGIGNKVRCSLLTTRSTIMMWIL